MPILDRMLYAASMAAGEKPRKLNRGRPKDPEVAKRRKEVQKRHAAGETPGEIGAALKTNVETVKKDLERVKS